MTKANAWLNAFRLRTLPLALASILMGSSAAYRKNHGEIDWGVLALCFATTILLQILSNLANDYGDAQKGTDNDRRIGPPRAIQSGLLTAAEVLKGMYVTIVLALVCGGAMLYLGMATKSGWEITGFFVIGLCAIAAAVFYTVGKRAYGYNGLGDLAVLLFFGIVGVFGSYYLLAHEPKRYLLAGAFGMGCLAAAVLNLNNMRDIENDEQSGKITLAVRLGAVNAKNYHRFLIAMGLLSFFIYTVVVPSHFTNWLWLLIVPKFWDHLNEVSTVDNPSDFDPMLKQLALSIFFLALLFAIGCIMDVALYVK